MSTTTEGTEFLTTEEAARLLRRSVRALHERTRTRAVPFRRAPGTRRCLFVRSELEAWLGGAPLEVVELHDGGIVVRPRADGGGRNEIGRLAS